MDQECTSGKKSEQEVSEMQCGHALGHKIERSGIPHLLDQPPQAPLGVRACTRGRVGVAAVGDLLLAQLEEGRETLQGKQQAGSGSGRKSVTQCVLPTVVLMDL